MNERFEKFTVLIAKISRNIKKIKNQEMAEYDLRSAHVSCLYYLYTSESLTSTELCERCEEDKATISRTIDYLEKNGFLVPSPQKAKRYKTPLALTEKGKMVGKKISDKVNLVFDEISGWLTEQERRDFYRYLTRISDGLDSLTM